MKKYNKINNDINIDSFYKINPYKNFKPNKNSTYKEWGFDKKLAKSLIKKTNPKIIIELGSWKGESAIAMGKIIEKLNLKTKIICIDTWLGGIGHIDINSKHYNKLKKKNGYPTIYYDFLSNVKKNNLEKIIIPIPTTTNIGSRLLKNKNIKADLIYIDAGHEEFDVYNDIKNYYSILSKKGVMFGDDYQKDFQGVVKGVKKFIKKNYLDIFVPNNRNWIIIKKDLFKYPKKIIKIFKKLIK